MALVFLRGHARKICMAEQAEKVWIGGSGERRVEQAKGDVHHVLLHQVLSVCLVGLRNTSMLGGWIVAGFALLFFLASSACWKADNLALRMSFSSLRCPPKNPYCVCSAKQAGKKLHLISLAASGQFYF